MFYDMTGLCARMELENRESYHNSRNFQCVISTNNWKNIKLNDVHGFVIKRRQRFHLH